MRYFLLLLLPFFFAASCSDDEELSPVDQLPPATQTGENVVACLIDGELWVNDPNRTGEVNISAIYNSDFNRISINAKQRDSDQSLLSIIGFRLTPPVVGVQSLNPFLIVFEDDPNGQPVRYEIDTVSSYQVTVTKIDFNQHILSGLFHGCLVSGSRRDTIQISDGHFDLTYY